jgi:hypothetical protein
MKTPEQRKRKLMANARARETFDVTDADGRVIAGGHSVRGKYATAWFGGAAERARFLKKEARRPTVLTTTTVAWPQEAF